MRYLPAVVAALFASGCGRYADFSLPPLPGGDNRATYTFRANPAPVLAPGDGWDSHDVLNPSVVDGQVNLYSGYDGETWRTGLAVASAPDRWERRGMVIEPDPRTWEGNYIAANGSALRAGAGLLYWYVAGPRERPRLGLARSADGAAWRKEPRPVFEPGPYASWDEFGVADPYVIRAGGGYYLFYLGQDRGWRQRIGVARSGDGVRWEKLRSNPVLESGEPGAFDEKLGEPAVWTARGFYWMLYTGRAADETRKLGLARSRDGVHWERLPQVFAGGEPWNASVVCDPTVEMLPGGRVAVWFGGGNRPRPDENLNGQIGYGVLTPVP
jgi:predicted GH43/DUF377 family glycosyl hydrolase